jgi:hypothetical protein
VLDCALIDSCALHTDQEVVLVIDEKYQYVLAKTVVLRRHIVLRMGQEPRLKDSSEIRRGHLVDICLCGENSKEIQDI